MAGLQAFYSSSAFNANIGAWNTASVTSLLSVSAFSAVPRNAARTRAWSGYKCIHTLFEVEM